LPARGGGGVRQRGPMRYELPDELRQLARWQEGILTARQVSTAGLSRDVPRSRLRQGRWQRIHSGVYATYTGPLPRSATLWAAVLRAGPGALLSFGTAAELDGLADEQSDPIHITLPASRRVTRIPGTRLHLSVRAVQARHPVATPPRTRIEETVLDLAGAAELIDDAAGWVTRAVGRGLTTPARLRAAMDQRGRLRWRAELAELLTPEMAGIHSALEYRYLLDVERPHALPRAARQARVTVGDRTQYRDVLYEDYGLAVELDGQAGHAGDARWRDIRRDNHAASAGIATLRYGWTDIHGRPCQVAAQVASVLRRNGYRGARPCSPGCPVPPAAAG